MCEKFQLLTQEIKDCLKVLHYYIFVADKTVYNRELTEERPLQDQVRSLSVSQLFLSSNIRPNGLYGHLSNNQCISPANIIYQSLYPE